MTQIISSLKAFEERHPALVDAVLVSVGSFGMSAVYGNWGWTPAAGLMVPLGLLTYWIVNRKYKKDEQRFKEFKQMQATIPGLMNQLRRESEVRSRLAEVRGQQHIEYK